MKTDWSSLIDVTGTESKICGNVVESIFDKDQKFQSVLSVRDGISLAYEFEEIVEQVVEIIRHTLGIAESAVVLLENDQQELTGLACGPAVGVQRQIRVSAKSGIASWVIRHAKPLIVNDAIGYPLSNNEFCNDIRPSIRSIMCAPLISHRRIIGVIEVFNKLNGDNFKEHDVNILVHIANTAAMAIENSRSQRSVIEEVKTTIQALAAAIDAKDPYTRGHSQRVVQYALMSGRSLSLSRMELEIIEYAGILHDIGKIGIPDAILSKRGALTAEEYEEIRKHPVISTNIIKDIPFLKPVRESVLHHHEKYNGSGYPDGLIGEDIPMGARVLAVADAFDAMTSDRPYRIALPEHHAIIELRKYSGKQFCPVALEAFLFALETEPGFYEWRSRTEPLGRPAH
ncbi:MAG TPA: HD domain-containing phosphohydrolase [Dehalococcoidia bacterium]|nr:HD domain-containing phosphohydrolase [Dehalococcoidia bacterium]